MGTRFLVVEGRLLGTQLCLDLQKTSSGLAVRGVGVVTRVRHVFPVQILCRNLNDQQREFFDLVGDVYPAQEEGKRLLKASVNRQRGRGECCRPDLEIEAADLE